ncbi:MAG TPA: hypothetical protein VM716_15215 [Gemmatimonadales bacterium]|nr:hypothetical protein [Gemmatimonadales bacterium]
MRVSGWSGIFGAAVLAAVAVAAILVRSHLLARSNAPGSPPCPEAPAAALDCYDRYYRSIVAERGVRAAFADLQARSSGDREVQRLCHAITHTIGQAATSKYADIAEAFSHADNMCGSGYYHGVLQGFAQAMGRDRVLSHLDTLCARVQGKDRKSLDYYNCVHGLGHALMAITDDDLFGALHDCDGLTGGMERNACANGVFMENLIVDGAHGGHYGKYLRPGEPLYPCTAVDAKYKAACFDIQTSYALGAVQGNFSRIFTLCGQVGAPYSTVCYRSLGRDAATLGLNQVPATVATCNLGSGREQRSNCLIGAALDFVYYYHSDVQAKALCAAADPDVRDDCRAATAKLAGLF